MNPLSFAADPLIEQASWQVVRLKVRARANIRLQKTSKPLNNQALIATFSVNHTEPTQLNNQLPSKVTLKNPSPSGAIP